MVNLDKEIEEKILEIVKPYHEQEDYKLNYLINDEEITFFASINEKEQIPEDVIEKITSILDASYQGSELVNQEFRYKFNLNPCGD